MEKYLKGIRLSELLARSFEGELPADEGREMGRLLAEFPDAGELVHKAFDETEIAGKILAYQKFDSDRIWNELNSRMETTAACPDTDEPVTEIKKPLRRIGRIVRYAAVLLIPVLVFSVVRITRNAGEEVTAPVAMGNHDPSRVQLFDAASGGYVDLDTLQAVAMQQLEELGLQADQDFHLDYSSGSAGGYQLMNYHTIAVPHGKDYRMKLSDGTVVWLYAGTELKYPSVFAGGTREVELKGEAFFEVLSDPLKPFIVKTAGCEIKVLGTAFNVKAYDEMDVVETSLAWGAVEVNGHHLEPNMQLRYDKSTGEVSYVPVSGMNYVLRTRNMFVFENMGIEEIMHELERWYDFEPVFMDQKMSNKRFSLKVKRDEELDFILHILQLTGEVGFTIGDDGRILITTL